MAGITLDALKQAVNSKYAPWEIDMGEAGTAVLHPMLRLNGKERQKLLAIQKDFNELQSVTESDQIEPGELEKAENASIEALRSMFRIVGRDHHKVDVFLETCGDDLAMLLEAFQQYSEDTQSGEVSASPNS